MPGEPEVRVEIREAVSEDFAVVAELFDRYLHEAMNAEWNGSAAAVEDMYVESAFRGRAVGIRLLAAAAASIQDGGGVFLRGMAVPDAAVRKLYSRSAVCRDTSECTLSGRAFRRLVDLRDSSVRELVTSLPEVSWNHEA